jgi:hypothetical protein
VATVGSVIAVLQGLDPELPVGALRVERHSEITAFDLGDVVEVHVEHRRDSGRPVAAWVVVGLPTADTPEVLYGAVPSTWTVTRAGCGCVMPVRVLPGRRVTTLAARCPHYEPGRIGLGLAALGRPQQ